MLGEDRESEQMELRERGRRSDKNHPVWKMPTLLMNPHAPQAKVATGTACRAKFAGSCLPTLCVSAGHQLLRPHTTKSNHVETARPACHAAH